jgi:hypothetical protein
MSGRGQKLTSRKIRVMSVIPVKADIHQCGLHVRYVPEADIELRCGRRSGFTKVAAELCTTLYM